MIRIPLQVILLLEPSKTSSHCKHPAEVLGGKWYTNLNSSILRPTNEATKPWKPNDRTQTYWRVPRADRGGQTDLRNLASKQSWPLRSSQPPKPSTGEGQPPQAKHWKRADLQSWAHGEGQPPSPNACRIDFYTLEVQLSQEWPFR